MADYKKLRETIDKKLSTDPEFRTIVKRINGGRATLIDTERYTQIIAHTVGKELASKVLELSDREGITTQILRDSYEDINATCARVQRAIDEKAGIHIRPQQEDFPAERVQQFTHSLVDPTVEDSVIKRRARAGSDTIVKSAHDDFIRKNATFRNDAGLTCYIIREGSNCCEWCSRVSGKYRFGTQPDDIFRRHDNCDCTIIYDGQVLRGKQNADGSRSKTWEEVPDADGSYNPTVLSPEEAERLQAKNKPKILTNGAKINNSSIDISSGSGIMRDNKTGIVLNTELYQGEVKLYDITQDRINHISDVELSSLSAENNQKLVQGCKDLLDYMNEVPLGCEGSIVFNMEMVEIDRYRSEITNSSLPAKTYSSECIVLHNHPSDTLFSDSDLQRFYEHDEYKILGAVGHNGSLYFAEKLPDYDMYGFWDYLEESKLQFPTKMSEEDIVKYVENVMKGAEEYGVKFYTKIYS